MCLHQNNHPHRKNSTLLTLPVSFAKDAAKNIVVVQLSAPKGSQRRLHNKCRRGSALIFIIMMVLATAFIVSVAATFGRATNDNEYRRERDRAATSTWDAAVSMADAKSAADSYFSLPATFPISLNGFTGTVTVASNNSNLVKFISGHIHAYRSRREPL